MSESNPKYLKFIALRRAKPDSNTRPATGAAPSVQDGKKKSTGESCSNGSAELGSVEAAALAGDWQSVDRRQRQRNAEEEEEIETSERAVNWTPAAQRGSAVACDERFLPPPVTARESFVLRYPRCEQRTG